MSSKLLIITLIFITVSCGVKGPPRAPGKPIPSVLDQYRVDTKKITSQKKQDEKDNKEKKQEED